MAGLNTVFASELEPHCCETLKANQLIPQLSAAEFIRWFEQDVVTQRCFANLNSSEITSLRDRVAAGRNHSFLEGARIRQGDLREVTSQEILAATRLAPGQLFMVAGGPPCQPFSKAGKRETIDVADGRLFLEFVRVVDDLRPRWFLFENVKGLLFAKTDVIRLDCKACKSEWIPPFAQRAEQSVEGICGCCGARTTSQRSNTERGGSLELILAEFRRLGYSCSWRVLNSADFGAPQLRERLFIVGSRDGETFCWPKPTHCDSAQVQLSLFEDPEAKWNTMLQFLWPLGHPRYGQLNPERAVLWVKNVVRPHAEPVTWRLDRPSPTVGAHQAAKFALAPDGVPAEQLQRQQWHTRGKRQRDLPPVPVEHSYLSDSELLRLQTFPDGWYLHGTRMQRAFQIGNAVPAVLGRALGMAILASSSHCAKVPSLC